MKQVKRRTWFCLVFTALLTLGILLFLARYFTVGGDWASFSANKHIYDKSGQLISGAVLDRTGTVLYDAASGAYSDDKIIRQATLHAVGDRAGNIATGARQAFSEQLSGFNPILGTTAGGHNVYLTLDADLNRTQRRCRRIQLQDRRAFVYGQHPYFRPGKPAGDPRWRQPL